MNDNSGPQSGHPAAPHPVLALLRSPGKGKIVSATAAVRLIRNGDTVATGGCVGIGFPEGVAVALEELFLAREDEHIQATGKPSLDYAAPPFVADWQCMCFHFQLIAHGVARPWSTTVVRGLGGG